MPQPIDPPAAQAVRPATSRHRPLIGVSPRLLREVPPPLGFRGKTLQYLEQSVAHWVMEAGALAVMIPTIETGGMLRRSDISAHDMAAALDGLLLQGGADVDPVMYGEPQRATRGPLDPARDRFERDLILAFAAAGKPVLGICRGMQLINVAFGGSLYQDLVSDGATGFEHVDDGAYDRHLHPVRIEPESLLAAIYGGAHAVRVNSIHHQGVRRLAEGFVVEARAPDGVVEAIRSTRHDFLLGTQWHPEFHAPDDPEGLLPTAPLLHALVDAAQRRRVAER
jgi:gamma-glutamyl-gamma-aminobutyrate hydrolase PuuD